MSNEELALNYKNGDKTALEQLYNNNHGVIYKIANSISQLNGEEEDYKQEAFFVIENCAKLYDPDRNIKFVSYFSKALVSRLVRYKLKNKLNAELSLDKPMNYGKNNNDEILLIDTIKDTSLKDADENLYDVELKEKVWEALDRLPELTANIVYYYYGVEYNTEDIAKYYNITVDQANEHKKKGMKALRKDRRLSLFWKRYDCIENTIDIDSRAYRQSTDSLAGALVDRDIEALNKHYSVLIFEKLYKSNIG